jgi:hypothetical protein
MEQKNPLLKIIYANENNLLDLVKKTDCSWCQP